MKRSFYICREVFREILEKRIFCMWLHFRLESCIPSSVMYSLVTAGQLYNEASMGKYPIFQRKFEDFLNLKFPKDEDNQYPVSHFNHTLTIYWIPMKLPGATSCIVMATYRDCDSARLVCYTLFNCNTVNKQTRGVAISRVILKWTKASCNSTLTIFWVRVVVVSQTELLSQCNSVFIQF